MLNLLKIGFFPNDFFLAIAIIAQHRANNNFKKVA